MGSKRVGERRRSPDVATEPGTAQDREFQAIGGYLRRQRELRGLSAEELASLTRIPLRSLERLESGHFDGHVDGFVRGFVRTVAAALGLDPDDTVSRMLSEPSVDEGGHIDLTPHWPPALAALAAIVLLAIAAGVISYVTADEPAVSIEARREERVYRRDPVRALAESQRASRTVASGMAATGPTTEIARPSGDEPPPASEPQRSAATAQ